MASNLTNSNDTLSTNLAALRRRHQVELASILEAAPLDGIEVIETASGDLSLEEGGVRLGSAYDPRREGIGIARSMAERPSDIMVAVGFGLGEQFEPFLEDNPGTLIIFEPSAARLAAAFRRRVFTGLIDADVDVYFATDLEFLSRLFSARYSPGLRVQFFPHPAILRLDGEAVAEAAAVIRNAKANEDTQALTSIEMLAPWALVTARNGRRVARTPQLGRLAGRFQGRPAVIAAAGPSLDKQLPLLRAIQDRVVVIAIGQTAKALIGAGIQPDIIHVLESRDVSHQLTDCGDTSQMIIAPSADADPAFFDLPCRAAFTVTPMGGAMGAWLARACGESRLSMGGGTVALGAVGIAELIGCDQIALIGQDLAFTEGRAYARNSAYEFVGIDLKEDGNCRFTNSEEKVARLGEKDRAFVNQTSPSREIVWVDGWDLGEKVPTWRAYASFIRQYSDVGGHLRTRGIIVTNCTEGGARIPSLDHTEFGDWADAVASEPFDARALILETHDAAPRFSLADFDEAIGAAQSVLRQVEKEARRGVRFIEKKREPLLRSNDAAHRAQLLAGIARHEKRVRRHLERAPWLDALVQPEIHNAIIAARRADRQDGDIEDLIDESNYLFRAALNGVGRARHWFEEFEGSFDSDRESHEGKGEGNDAIEVVPRQPSDPANERPPSRVARIGREFSTL